MSNKYLVKMYINYIYIYDFISETVKYALVMNYNYMIHLHIIIINLNHLLV